MGKKKNTKTSLGKQLMKDRFGTSRHAGESFDLVSMTTTIQTLSHQSSAMSETLQAMVGKAPIALTGQRNDQQLKLHTSEMNDGFEWQKCVAQSVTEETSLEAFLSTAELASRDFSAERLNAAVVATDTNEGILSKGDKHKVKQAQEENKSLLRIPRRPAWDESTTPEQLDRLEKDTFLDWRRKLAELEEKEHILMTPFERNIEFWRQLWRVIERSDIIIQIVDARNPLLFRSEDLETYVKEVNENKMIMLLINKADYLSEKQRMHWAEYFDNIDIRVAFWSAVEETDRMNQKEEEQSENSAESAASNEMAEIEDVEEEYTNVDELFNATDDDQIFNMTKMLSPINTEEIQQIWGDTSDADCRVFGYGISNPPSSYGNMENTISQSEGQLSVMLRDGSETSPGSHDSELSSPPGFEEDVGYHGGNSTRILNGDELVELLKSFHNGPQTTDGIITVGLVGYPNVGKSSTINALLRCKKVPVSSTPGRTKHFQTLYLEDELMLCDCPGLVLPSFVATKAEMVLNGILPIDQLRDYVPPVAALCQYMSRTVLEATYGIMLPIHQEDGPRPPTAHELLSSYGLMRGYMSHKGVPDYHRSARCILKDFVSGKLLYCTPPPNVSPTEYDSCHQPQRSVKLREVPTYQRLPKGVKNLHKYKNEVDKEFFSQQHPHVGCKGVHGKIVHEKQGAGHWKHVAAGAGSLQSSVVYPTGKPWKRHGNRGKKEKLRRIHAHLDVVE